MDGITLLFLLFLAFLTGFLAHWFMTRKQRRLLKEYRKYKKALAVVDQNLLMEKQRRRPWKR